MHYSEFKQDDEDLLQTLIRTFPFAVIAINGPSRPLIAQAPLTFRTSDLGRPMVDFHLARENAFTAALEASRDATIVVNGPSAHVSPGWYTARFPDRSSDRSRTAPTYDYLTVTMSSRLASGLSSRTCPTNSKPKSASSCRISPRSSGFMPATALPLRPCAT